MKDLGYMNGWKETPKELIEAIAKDYEIKEERIGPCLRKYTCEQGGFFYKVDSSD